MPTATAELDVLDAPRAGVRRALLRSLLGARLTLTALLLRSRPGAT
ncbi:MAG TPA: hypothetical protein VID70_01500 [Solirubrobacteraceae bacterium]